MVEELSYNGWTEKKLNDFNEEVIAIYKTGKIKSPIHLSGDNAQQLINIYKEYKITPQDWVLGTWRSHWHWLLSGRDKEELKKQIIEGHSMHIYGDKFFTSSIVGGIAPIATGIAYALKMNNSKDRVFCFLGDSGGSCGISMESYRFVSGHSLPAVFIIEDNQLSVNAITADCWGRDKKEIVRKYSYARKYNHAGIGLNGYNYQMF